MQSMKARMYQVALAAPWVSFPACAAEVYSPSPTGGVFRMLLGLMAVLAVMALIVWVMKRFTPGSLGQQSVVRVVGGVSVGTRERIVVVEVADRWLVVGVAPGQVNSIANLEAGSMAMPADSHGGSGQSDTSMQPFARWLKKSIEKPNA